MENPLQYQEEEKTNKRSTARDVFLCLIVVLVVFAILGAVIYALDGNETKELTTRKPAVKDDCENRILINDGVCDEVANIADCLFDGGDCCLEDKDTKYCQDCECKSSGTLGENNLEGVTVYEVDKAYQWNIFQLQRKVQDVISRQTCSEICLTNPEDNEEADAWLHNMSSQVCKCYLIPLGQLCRGFLGDIVTDDKVETIDQVAFVKTTTVIVEECEDFGILIGGKIPPNNDNNEGRTEVMSLSDDWLVCQSPVALEKNIIAGMGGLIFDSMPVVCGGTEQEDTSFHAGCIDVSSMTERAQLLIPRQQGASIVFGQSLEKMLIAGGISVGSDGEGISSTEIVSFNIDDGLGTSEEGPDIPIGGSKGSQKNCMAKVTEDLAVMVGNYFPWRDEHFMHWTLLFHTDTTTWSNGQFTFKMRYGPFCGTVKDSFTGKRLFVVAGGAPYGYWFSEGPDMAEAKTAEIWDMERLTWVQSFELPPILTFGASVSNKDHTKLWLAGGFNDHEKEESKTVFEVTCNNSVCSIGQTDNLKIARSKAVGMNIPGHLLNCTIRDNTTTTESTTTTTEQPICGLFETFLIDNGKCDGLPNTEICGYDNGECCDSNKNCSYCGTCLCHLDGLKYCYEEGGNEFVGPGLTQNPTLPELEVVGPGLTQNPTPPELPVAPTPELEECGLLETFLIDNGACDMISNTEACGYDNLECCDNTKRCQFSPCDTCFCHLDGLKYCYEEESFEGVGPGLTQNPPILPPLPVATPSNTPELEECGLLETFLVGNGACDMISNTEACGYDNMECCDNTKKCQFSPCDTCLCHLDGLKHCYEEESFEGVGPGLTQTPPMLPPLPVATPGNTPELEECGLLETFLTGNGACDMISNTEACGYDNLECCDNNIKCQFSPCDTCLCHLDGLKYCYEEDSFEMVGPGLEQVPPPPEVPVLTTSTIPETEECGFLEAFMIDNGACDLISNNEACGYDNGECCDDTKMCQFCGTCLCHLDGYKYCYDESDSWSGVGPGLEQQLPPPDLQGSLMDAPEVKSAMFDQESSGTALTTDGDFAMVIGNELDNIMTIEALSLSNPLAVCEDIGDFPFVLAGMTGGILDAGNDGNNLGFPEMTSRYIPIICGGRGKFNWGDKSFCLIRFSTGMMTPVAELQEARYDVGSLVVGGGSTLWVLGGSAHEQHHLQDRIITETTDLVSLNQNGTGFTVRQGPRMPEPIEHYCFIGLNDTVGFLVKSKTWFFNLEQLDLDLELPDDQEMEGEWTDGPEMITKDLFERKCGMIFDAEDPSVRYVVAIPHTEFWIVDSDGWIEGPAAPDPGHFLYNPLTMVNSDKTAFIVLGTGTKLQKFWCSNMECQWSVMQQQLKYTWRNGAFAMAVPEELVDCN